MLSKAKQTRDESLQNISSIQRLFGSPKKIVVTCGHIENIVIQQDMIRRAREYDYKGKGFVQARKYLETLSYAIMTLIQGEVGICESDVSKRACWRTA